MEGIKEIDFNYEQIIYLLLNIIGHDVIHDFYGNLGKPRWEKIRALVKQLNKSYTLTPTGGNGKKRGSEVITSDDTDYSESKSSGFSVIEPQSKKLRPTIGYHFPGTGQKLSSDDEKMDVVNESDDNIDYDNIDYEILRFIDDISITILFNYFYFNILTKYNVIGDNISDTLENDINNCKLFFMQSKCDFNQNYDFKTQMLYDKLYDTLSDKFIEYYNTQPIKENLNYFDLLNNFFNNKEYFKDPIINFLNATPIVGGAKMEELTNDILSKIIKDTEDKLDDMITKEDSPLIKLSNGIYNIVKNENITNDKLYNDLRGEIMKSFTEIFDVKNYPETYGSIMGTKLIPTLNRNNKFFNKIKQNERESKNYFISEIKFNLGELLQPYKELYLLNQPKKTKVKTYTFNYDVKQKFAYFIIKGALYLTECFDKAGNLNRSNKLIETLYSSTETLYSSTENISDLKNQIDILRSVLYCIETEKENFDKNAPKLIKKFDSEILTKIDATNCDSIPKEYDDYLLNFIIKKYFKDFGFQKDKIKYDCDKLEKNYVINNAGSFKTIGKNLSKKVLCPYSSIIDGMISCSYSSASKHNNFERGDMNFQLICKESDKNYYYNGLLNLSDKTVGDINLKLNIQLPLIKITSKLDLNIKDKNSPLIAHSVLNRTLKSITNFIVKQEIDVRDQIFLDGKILENLFNIATDNVKKDDITINIPDVNYDGLNLDVDPNVNKNMNIFNLIFSNILQKGIGDIFQEINAVCKNGGYVDKYECGTSVLPFNEDGEQTRFFCAADRPSSCRFIFMLVNGREDQINSKAYGGMSSETRAFIFTKNNTINPCSEESDKMITGGFNNKTVKNKNKIKNKKTFKKNKKTIKKRKTIKKKKLHIKRKTRKY